MHGLFEAAGGSPIAVSAGMGGTASIEAFASPDCTGAAQPYTLDASSIDCAIGAPCAAAASDDSGAAIWIGIPGRDGAAGIPAVVAATLSKPQGVHAVSDPSRLAYTHETAYSSAAEYAIQGLGNHIPGATVDAALAEWRDDYEDRVAAGEGAYTASFQTGTTVPFGGTCAPVYTEFSGLCVSVGDLAWQGGGVATPVVELCASWATPEIRLAFDGLDDRTAAVEIEVLDMDAFATAFSDNVCTTNNIVETVRFLDQSNKVIGNMSAVVGGGEDQTVTGTVSVTPVDRTAVLQVSLGFGFYKYIGGTDFVVFDDSPTYVPFSVPADNPNPCVYISGGRISGGLCPVFDTTVATQTGIAIAKSTVTLAAATLDVVKLDAGACVPTADGGSIQYTAGGLSTAAVAGIAVGSVAAAALVVWGAIKAAAGSAAAGNPTNSRLLDDYM